MNLENEFLSIMDYFETNVIQDSLAHYRQFVLSAHNFAVLVIFVQSTVSYNTNGGSNALTVHQIDIS